MIRKLAPLRPFVILGLIAIAFAYWIASTALQKGISTLDRGLLVAVTLGAGFLLYRKTRSLFRESGGASGEAGVDFLNLFLAFITVITTSLSLMAPRPATESEAGIIEGLSRSILSTGEDTNERVKRLEDELLVGRQSRIEQGIAGIWGEPACMVTYAFELVERELKVSSVTSIAGMPDQQWRFDTQPGRDELAPGGGQYSRMVSEEIEGNFPTSFVTFTLRESGAGDRLVWDSSAQQQDSVELIRCDT